MLKDTIAAKIAAKEIQTFVYLKHSNQFDFRSIESDLVLYTMIIVFLSSEISHVLDLKTF
jgi:hypothetical protein